jgi:dihydroneopterin triphosphate diphosphatase
MLSVISNMIEAHVFRINKGELEFLLLKRSEKEIYPGLWQMVSGSIHEGETAYQTALREIVEETNLKPTKIWVVPNVNSFYSHEKNYISLLPVFAVKVNPNSKVRISDEHTEYKWMSKNKAKKMLAWVGQRKSVDIISDYFTKKKSFLKFVEVKI